VARISVRERRRDLTSKKPQCKDQGGAQKTFDLKMKAAEFQK